jgi:hypothetical protein
MDSKDCPPKPIYNHNTRFCAVLLCSDWRLFSTTPYVFLAFLIPHSPHPQQAVSHIIHISWILTYDQAQDIAQRCQIHWTKTTSQKYHSWTWWMKTSFQEIITDTHSFGVSTSHCRSTLFWETTLGSWLRQANATCAVLAMSARVMLETKEPELTLHTQSHNDWMSWSIRPREFNYLFQYTKDTHQISCLNIGKLLSIRVCFLQSLSGALHTRRGWKWTNYVQ